MISIPAGARVLLATRPVDFRKGAHGLAALAQEILGEDPFSGGRRTNMTNLPNGHRPGRPAVEDPW